MKIPLTTRIKAAISAFIAGKVRINEHDLDFGNAKLIIVTEKVLSTTQRALVAQEMDGFLAGERTTFCLCGADLMFHVVRNPKAVNSTLTQPSNEKVLREALEMIATCRAGDLEGYDETCCANGFSPESVAKTALAEIERNDREEDSQP